MLTIIICDDIAAHADYAEQLVRAAMGQRAEYALHKFNSPAMLAEAVSNGALRPDIAILDISMGEQDGIDLAEQLHQAVPHCKVIFLTSYAKFASAVYRQDHTWFILKESAAEYMPEALQKAVSELQAESKKEPATIQLHSRGVTRNISLDEILYLERSLHSTNIITKEGKYTVTTHPEELTQACADRFIRCHQSYWVNSTAIRELNKTQFILTDGTEISISRTYRDEARRQFFQATLNN